MEHLVMLRLEKQVVLCFEGLPNSSHSPGLPTACEPLCQGVQQMPRERLYRVEPRKSRYCALRVTLRVFNLNCWQNSMAPSVHFRNGVYSVV